MFAALIFIKKTLYKTNLYVDFKAVVYFFRYVKITSLNNYEMMLKSDQMELMYKNGNSVIKYLGLLQKII